MSRNAYTPCDFEECKRSPANGHALFRVNPKGELGIFMCSEHYVEHTTAEQQYTSYYISQDWDGENRRALDTWSVYAELYPDHRRDSEPIDGSQRLVVAGLPDEDACRAFIRELRREIEIIRRTK